MDQEELQDESSSRGVSLLDISLFPAHVFWAIIASDNVFLVTGSTNWDTILTKMKQQEYIYDLKTYKYLYINQNSYFDNNDFLPHWGDL